MSSNGETTESKAAMSLWQKFAELQNTADALRTERRRIEGESTRLEAQIQRLKQELASESETVQSRGNSHDGDYLCNDLDVLNEEYSAAVKAKNTAEMALEQWNAWKQEEMEQTMAFERNFRSQCDHWKLRAMAVSLDNSFIEAAIFSKDPTNAPMVPLGHIALTGKESDPLLWDIPQDDEMLKIAVASYQDQINERNAVEKLLEQDRGTLRAIVDKQIASDQRAVGLQARLDAILEESKGLQSGLSEVEELILHEEALVETYRKKIEERQRRSSQPDRTRHVVALEHIDLRTATSHQSPDRAGGIGTHNPYIQNRTQTNAITIATPSIPSGPRSLRPNPVTERATSVDRVSDQFYRDNVMDAVLGPRRRRRDRYFGCSVSVGAPMTNRTTTDDLLQEDDSDDDLLFSPGFTKKRKNTVEAQQDDHSDD